jgi:uncharacterized protein (TIGR03437 family)
VKYYFSNGGANINFNGSLSNSNLIAGTKYLYFSPDGNFVFGGSPTGWDMIVGVKSGSGTPAFNNLYYQAGAYQDLSGGYGNLYTFYGSLKPVGQTVLGHQRLLTLFNNNPLDYTYTSSLTFNSDGTADDGIFHYVFGPGGTIRIGSGKGTLLGATVAIAAPAFTPSGVYIYPTGVVNAASSALFTSGVAPGELITIYGSNLASTTAVDVTFPTTLAGVQVYVNNRLAPIYVVSATQISAIIPYATTELVASIQVVNNGTRSNIVPAWVTLTAPGVFTQPAGGIGTAAALHTDYSLVTSNAPLHIGDTVLLYVTGLGAVSPAVADGSPGPVSPLSYATNTIKVYIGGQQATTSFVGLAPQLVGLYQINAQIPSGVTSGNASVDISGPDFYTTQATIPIQ